MKIVSSDFINVLLPISAAREPLIYVFDMFWTCVDQPWLMIAAPIADQTLEHWTHTWNPPWIKVEIYVEVTSK